MEIIYCGNCIHHRMDGSCSKREDLYIYSDDDFCSWAEGLISEIETQEDFSNLSAALGKLGINAYAMAEEVRKVLESPEMGYQRDWERWKKRWKDERKKNETAMPLDRKITKYDKILQQVRIEGECPICGNRTGMIWQLSIFEEMEKAGVDIINDCPRCGQIIDFKR